MVEKFVDHFCAYGFAAFEDHNSSDYLLEMKDRMVAMEMERYYQLAKKILIDNRAFFDAMKTELVQKYILTCKDIAAIREDCGKE